jgi:hypothetical protein
VAKTFTHVLYRSDEGNTIISVFLCGELFPCDDGGPQCFVSASSFFSSALQLYMSFGLLSYFFPLFPLLGPLFSGFVSVNEIKCHLRIECAAKQHHFIFIAFTIRRYAPHNDVSVDGPHIRRWSHKIIKDKAILLQA